MGRVFFAIIFALAAVLLGVRWFAPGLFAPRAAPTETSRLNSEKGTDQLYRLPAADQQILLGAVEHFCVKEYHRDSCIHHLITCGVPCLVAVPKKDRKRVFDDYEKLRAERGLPKLPQTPHGLDDD